MALVCSLYKYVKRSVILSLFIFLANSLIFPQTETNVSKLLEFAQKKTAEFQTKKAEALNLARAKGFTIRSEDENGKIIEIMSLKNGIPQYYETHNIGAAATTRADKLWTAPYNITGSGFSQLGEWDGGAVRTTHQEFNGRVTQVDGATSISNHATHVAGTLIASGVVADAKGMAYGGTLKAWEWTDDEAEMATAAANGLEISNHSYGFIRGWYLGLPGPKGIGNYWYGDKTISEIEDYGFGFYDTGTQDVDQIAYDAPNYLIVKSAGNDRADRAYTSITYLGRTILLDSYWWDNDVNDWIIVPDPQEPPKDGGTAGYDCIGTKGVAKNILTVGAVEEVTNYTNSSDVVMSDFSGWGPTDDGRIKPDVVAKGVDVYSSEGDSDTDYNTYSGTSMSSPNTAGTLALLQQYYQQTHNSEIMRAATLKALVIHSADEAGSNPGPDYSFGWGLVNAEHAAEIIEEDISTANAIDEQVLSNGSTYSRSVVTDGSEPLVVTIVWTDIPGTPVAYSLDPSDPMLVHDLDLKITKDATTYYTWKLDKNNPASAATNNSKNDVDNVEKVEISSPASGTYLVEVSHKGTLTTDQAFSIIISGDTTPLGVLADIKVMLQGPFDGSSAMNTQLGGSIPLTSPYSEDPRTVSSIPADIVDWILVELRETANGTTLVSKSCLLRNDGMLMGDDGSSKISLNIAAGNYHIVVKHRNHLPIMSKNPVSLPNSTTYDFTTGPEKYYGDDAGAVQLN